MAPPEGTAGDRERSGDGRFMEWPDFRGVTTTDHEIEVEEFSEDGHLVVRAEMPGLDPDDDIEIILTDHTLHLHAERRPPTETESKQGYRSEFRYGSFSRSVSLPVGATAGDVQAVYDNGILEVRIRIDADDVDAGKSPM